MLTECFFPNLQSLLLCTSCLVTDNNHIVNIKSLRKCYFPFLSELIIDSNNISDIYPLYEIISVHVQRLEISTLVFMQTITGLLTSDPSWGSTTLVSASWGWRIWRWGSLWRRERTRTAGRNYAKGNLLIYDNLCKFGFSSKLLNFHILSYVRRNN